MVRLRLLVHAISINFSYAVDRNAIPLLDGKRVIGGLQFDERPYAIVPEVGAGLEILGPWIQRQIRGEPTEEWPDVRPFWLFKSGHEPAEICLGKRYPNTPDEFFRRAMDRKFQAATNEEVLLIDNTGIAG